MAASYAMYQEQILEHYKKPRHRGPLEGATHEARESNPLCGDDLTLRLRVDGSGRIAEARFEGQGCAISLASADMLAERIVGKGVGEAEAVAPRDVQAMLGIPLSAVREKCAVLGLDVLRQALRRKAPGSGT